MYKRTPTGASSGFIHRRTALGIFLFAFGTISCSDGVLDSGADMGSPVTEDTEADSSGDSEVDSEPIAIDSSTETICGKFAATIEGSDVCWYLGQPVTSCTETCAPAGGVHPDAPFFVGTPAQGGSAAKCITILTALHYPGLVITLPAPTAKGLGCYVFMNGYHYWINDIDFDPAEKEYGTSMVCGCMR